MEDGKACGTLCTERRGLYTIFRAEVETKNLCRLFAEFESGEIVLGVPAPEHGKMRLCVSIPTSRLPGGILLRGSLRTGSSEWERFPGGTIGTLKFPAGYRNGKTYRFPWMSGDRLPCEQLLCFYRLVCDRDCSYLEINLDEHGCPAE